MLTYKNIARNVRLRGFLRKEQNAGNRFSAIFANDRFDDLEDLEAVTGEKRPDIGFRMGITQRRGEMEALALPGILDGKGDIGA
jgi:hypothetical protein